MRRSRCHSELDRVEAVDVLKQADLAFWHAPDAPVRVSAGPGTLTKLNESLGEPVPRRAVAEHVLLSHGATIPGVRRRLPEELIDVLPETPRHVSMSSAVVCAEMAGLTTTEVPDARSAMTPAGGAERAVGTRRPPDRSGAAPGSIRPSSFP
jgi:hypothetical protein